MVAEYQQRSESEFTRLEDVVAIITNSDSIRSSYDTIGPKIDVQLGEVGNNFQFLLGSNRDLFAIKKNGTDTGSSEVHAWSAASNYQVKVVETGTPLGETGDEWTFSLWGYDHLMAIRKRGGDSGMMEVKVLEAGTNYQTFKPGMDRMITAMPELDDHCRIISDRINQLYVIKKSGTDSGKTEVHILVPFNKYDSFFRQVATAQEETDETVDFQVASNIASNSLRDVYMIKKSGTASNTTEIHVLSAERSYEDFDFHTPTALGVTDRRFDLLLRVDYQHPDFYVVKRRQTGTGHTQLRILTA